MSVRNMLEVMMSLLLATTIGATADTHAARVHQSPASVAAAGKSNDKIPFLLCQRICIGRCLCDWRPPEFAECICSKPGDSTESNKPAALLHTSEETLQVKGKLENSDLIPYVVCPKICRKCACTKMWPPEINMCSCLDDSVPKKAATVADRLDHSLASVIEETLQVKGKSENSGPIPYIECMKTCSNCLCTQKWPPESNICLCLEDDSVPKKAAAVVDRLDQSLASVTEQTLQVKGKLEHPDLIPYTECMKTCSNCACTRKWPPESNMCFCFKDDSVTKKAAVVADRLDRSFAYVTEKTNELYEKLDLFAGPVPKRIGGDYKKMVLWTTSKTEATIPYTECIKTCETCACTPIWPPERAICFCITPKSQAAGGKAVAK